MHPISEFALVTFTSVLFIVDPIAVVPSYLVITRSETAAQRAATARRACIAAALILIAFAIGGTLIFELFVSDVANFKTATGELAVFLVLIGYVYTSSIILMVGVELDELLREDATAGERGVLHVLFGVGK